MGSQSSQVLEVIILSSDELKMKEVMVNYFERYEDEKERRVMLKTLNCRNMDSFRVYNIPVFRLRPKRTLSQHVFKSNSEFLLTEYSLLSFLFLALSST
jgi:ATP-dependent exoDNAse (exonuclease V) beta subunit